MEPVDLHRKRWDGRSGRLEVWYTTATDEATGTGLWLHHEVVSPTDGAPAYGHGWAAVFPPGRPPTYERFGPHPVEPSTPGFAVPDVTAGQDSLHGKTGRLSWDLAVGDGGAALYTFPRWAWQNDVLPAAQVVARPTARVTGQVRVDGEDRVVDGPGASARIYGHGNAERWAWLHADLGGGDVCEIVAAVSTRPGLDRLPPLPFVRLRVDGRDLPSGDPLLVALRLRADIGLPAWTVRGRIGDRLLRVEVAQRPEETVAVDYADPDGAPAVCHNTERADVRITLARRSGRSWATEREWRLDGTGHAEVGLR